VPDDNTRFYFVGIDKARFRRPVEPGDQLILQARFERSVRGIWRLATMAEVAGEEVAHAQIMIAPDLKGGNGAPALGELP
jgi:3-hydroxyacyl-[acyl-carrier-protein] dehydratase